MMNPKPGDVVAYKVRDPKTGLYQMGGSGRHRYDPAGRRVIGCDAAWSKTGKTWNSMGHLKAHFTLLRETAGYKNYLAKQGQPQSSSFVDPVNPDWEILELTVSTSQSGTYRCGDIIAEAK